MKLLTTTLLAALILCGCSARDADRAVRAKFKGCDVVSVPGEDYKFLVRTPSNEVRLVKCYGAMWIENPDGTANTNRYGNPAIDKMCDDGDVIFKAK